MKSAKEGTHLGRLNAGMTSLFTRAEIKSPGEFYRQFYTKIYRFVFVQTGAPHTDVEDIVQEALLAAWRARDRYEGESQLETWIAAIAKHKIADYRRTQARLDRRSLEAVRLALRRAETIRIADELLDTVEMRECVEAALSQLDPHYARVLSLRYLQDLSVRSIALELGESEAAVESRLSRARDAFRDSIRGESRE